MAVITSPAPLAKAIRVTAAMASVNFSASLIQVMPSAIYSSTVAEINWNIRYIITTEMGKKQYNFPKIIYQLFNYFYNVKQNVNKLPSRLQYNIEKKLNLSNFPYFQHPVSATWHY